MIERTLVVGAGGFLGAAARYVLGGVLYRWLHATFPWATFVINVTGCFGIGFLAVLAEERMLLSPAARLRSDRARAPSGDPAAPCDPRRAEGRTRRPARGT